MLTKKVQFRNFNLNFVDSQESEDVFESNLDKGKSTEYMQGQFVKFKTSMTLNCEFNVIGTSPVILSVYNTFSASLHYNLVSLSN